MKTSKLTGAQLDWAVAKCEGKNGILYDDGITRCIVVATASGVYKGTYRPSVNWSQGGPIIEREDIAVWPDDEEGGWFASLDGGRCEDYKGPTPLIAAMLCYVASKMGSEIEVPKELT